jgi:hypothetical protein
MNSPVDSTPEKRPHILRERSQQAIERLVRAGRTDEEAEGLLNDGRPETLVRWYSPSAAKLTPRVRMTGIALGI